MTGLAPNVIALALTRFTCVTALAATCLACPQRARTDTKASGPRPAGNRVERAAALTKKAWAGSALRFGASPMPVRSIARLVDRTAEIALGTVLAVEEVGERLLTTRRDPEGYGRGPVRTDALTYAMAAASADQFRVLVRRAHLDVASVVKGPALQTSDITVEFYEPRDGHAPWTPLETGQHGLFFLDNAGRVADVFYPFLPIAAEAPLVAPGLPPIEAIKQYLLLSLRPDTPEATLASCIEGVIDLKAAQATDYLVDVAAAKDPQIAGDGLWGLIAFQDARAFPAATEFVLRAPAGARRQVGRILGAVAELRDPKLGPAVMPLLSTENAAWRQDALTALRNMKDPRNVPALIYALSDADLENRYVAMMAVAETTGRESGMPSWPRFQENPAYWLGLTFDWWDREGKQQYAGK